MTLLVMGLCYAGHYFLCLSMKRGSRHGDDLSRGRRRTLRCTGSLLLSLTAWLAIQRWGMGEGIVTAFICAGVSGLALVFLMPYRPKAATAMVLLLPVAGLALRVV